jgi:thiosulfate/3-mercaptopyruvate sulfurtransferase
MTYTTLIDAAALQQLLAGSTPPVLIDARFDLADPAAGERAYRETHLPGAHYLHLDRDLSAAKTGRNGRHPLPQRSLFAARIGALGIGPQTQVVAYDAQGGSYAARVWWMLRWLGHEAAAVLDGGLPAWVAAGGTVDDAGAAWPATTAPYPERASLVSSVDADALLARLGRTPLIDARAPERFRGDVEPLDKAAGHIPGARNRFFQKNVNEEGTMRPPSELAQEFREIAGSGVEIVCYCGSGVTACQNLLALEHAGIPGAKLYAGSWSEWSADPSRPIATGDEDRS